MIVKLSELKSMIKSTITEALDNQFEEVDLGNSNVEDDQDDEEDVEAEPIDDEGGGDEETVDSIDSVPSTIPELRIWLRDFVAPEIPISQIPAFHRFVKIFIQKAKDVELKSREPALKKRLDVDKDAGDEEMKPKKKQGPPSPPSKKVAPPKAPPKRKSDEEDEDEDE